MIELTCVYTDTISKITNMYSQRKLLPIILWVCILCVCVKLPNNPKLIKNKN